VFAGYQSTYFEGWLVRDVMNVQLGWDVTYNTRYYAPAYMPSSGMFYLQNERLVGVYPFVDVFLNFQIKKARFFIKTDGLYSLMSGEDKILGKEYFMVYRYPLNVFRIKFGVSWAFYN
ncbi:MAG: putative porin, partial [Bacteroidales bacterium]|nr:putative porin [Bacteroidales bacterium]